MNISQATSTQKKKRKKKEDLADYELFGFAPPVSGFANSVHGIKPIQESTSYHRRLGSVPARPPHAAMFPPRLVARETDRPYHPRQHREGVRNRACFAWFLGLCR